MKTVREWIEFLGDDENYIFGLRLKGGIPCPPKHYFLKEEALERYAWFLDDIVVEAFPMNIQLDDKIGALLIYEREEPPA